MVIRRARDYKKLYAFGRKAYAAKERDEKSTTLKWPGTMNVCGRGNNRTQNALFTRAKHFMKKLMKIFSVYFVSEFFITNSLNGGQLSIGFL